MEFQSYNSELAIANLLFKRLFSNIRIGRTDSTGKETQIQVLCVLGQRSRIVKNLENPEKRGNLKVPMIAINRTGYARNGDRLNNLNNEVKYEIRSSDRRLHLMAPVPVDISYDVSIIAKYPADIDKIASNFMVFFNSDVYVSCEHPKYEGVKMNNQVIMSDSISEDHSDEMDGTQDDLITATFQFTFKTFLFGGTRRAKLVPQKVLSSCVSSYVETSTVEIAPDEIDAFQAAHPDASVSASLTSWVTKEITSYVDNPDISATVYDDIPIINKIDFGLYVVPNKHDIAEYMLSVDNGAFGNHEHIDRLGYISSESYGDPELNTHVDPYGVLSIDALSACEYGDYIKPLSTSGDYYDKVDWNCTLEPYVEKMYWSIDMNISSQFPNNIRWDRQ